MLESTDLNYQILVVTCESCPWTRWATLVRTGVETITELQGFVVSIALLRIGNRLLYTHGGCSTRPSTLFLLDETIEVKKRHLPMVFELL